MAKTTPTNINLSALQRKTFTIDGDPNRVLALNTSDLSVLHRLSEAEATLKELSAKALTMNDASDVNKLGDTLDELDKEMRACLDRVFDANVSEVCAPSGSMFDPINGKLRYEYIVTALTSLYESDITREMELVGKRVSTHTAKYTT